MVIILLHLTANTGALSTMNIEQFGDDDEMEDHNKDYVIEQRRYIT